MRSSLHLIFLVGASVLFPGITTETHAAILHVDPATGADTNTGSSWEQALATLTEAAERSNQGDLIRIAQGDFHESPVFPPEISIEGGYATGGQTRDWQVFRSVIDGDNERRCAEIADGVMIDGVHFERGRAIDGGALSIISVDISISNCAFVSCTATGGNPHGGGAIYLNQSDSVITDCRFTANRTHTTADVQSGETCGGAVMMWSSSPMFKGCLFELNETSSERDDMLLLGGAVWCIASQPIFSGSTFTGNHAEIGGAVGWWNRSMPDIENCQFRMNTADNSGGALAIIFHESFVPESRHRLIDCVFEDNQSTAGGAIVLLRNACYELINCRFTGNHAVSTGGALYLDSSVLFASSCTFAENSVVASEVAMGAAVYIHDARLSLRNSIIAFNLGAPALDQTPARPADIQIDFCDVFGNVPENYGSSIIDRTGISGNISQDPLLIVSDTLGYCLSDPDTGDPEQIAKGKSPCINTGDIRSALHAAWRSTRTDQVRDGSIPDMGCHVLTDGPMIVMAYPGPEDDFSDGTRVGSIVLRDRTGDIDPASVSLSINGVPHTTILRPIHRGVSVFFQVDTSIPDCTLLEIIIDACSLDQPPENMQPQTLICRSPGCPGTPTPTPTSPSQPEPPELSFDPAMAEYSSGDQVHSAVTVYNGSFSPQIVDLHVCLEIGGQYYFFPFWDRVLHAILVPLYPGESQSLTVLDFEVPADVGPAGPFLLYGVMTVPGTYEPVGDLALGAITFL